MTRKCINIIISMKCRQATINMIVITRLKVHCALTLWSEGCFFEFHSLYFYILMCKVHLRGDTRLQELSLRRLICIGNHLREVFLLSCECFLFISL